MKQTAIEWLVEEFKEKLTGNNLPNWFLDVIQQAKEMEKEQIVEAYYQIGKDHQDMIFAIEKDAEQYYNETFKSE